MDENNLQVSAEDIEDLTANLKDDNPDKVAEYFETKKVLKTLRADLKEFKENHELFKELETATKKTKLLRDKLNSTQEVKLLTDKISKGWNCSKRLSKLSYSLKTKKKLHMKEES